MAIAQQGCVGLHSGCRIPQSSQSFDEVHIIGRFTCHNTHIVFGFAALVVVLVSSTITGSAHSVIAKFLRTVLHPHVTSYLSVITAVQKSAMSVDKLAS